MCLMSLFNLLDVHKKGKILLLDFEKEKILLPFCEKLKILPSGYEKEKTLRQGDKEAEREKEKILLTFCEKLKKWKHWGGVTKKQRQATFRKRLNLLEFKAEHRWILHWNEFLLSTLGFLFLFCVIYAASFLLLFCSFHKLFIDCNVRWICL